MFSKELQLQNFRTPRYDYLNKLRWNLFLELNIPLKGKVIFEPGAGIGDQTEWLLNQGAKHIYVNDGRIENLEFIKERFRGDDRLTFILGDIETCLDQPQFAFTVDFIFCWGVYYHVNDVLPDLPIMRNLSRIGHVIAFDYLEGDDRTEQYGYDNPSTSISRFSPRPKTETLVNALKNIWSHVYMPRNQMNWHDDSAPFTPRRICVASKYPIESDNLIHQ